MIDFAFSILAIPVRFLAWLFAVLRIMNPLPLVRGAWSLSRDSQDAAGVVNLTAASAGIEAAQGAAMEMFEKTGDCNIIATLCWIHIQQLGNIIAANKWYLIGVEQGSRNEEMLLPVKLYLSNHLAEYDKQQILEEILSRNDLPMEFTRGALLDKAGMLLKANRWDQAEAIADRILKVEDQANATWAKWVVSNVRGNNSDASKFKEQLQKQAGPGYSSLLMAMGWLYMGNKREAIIEMHQAERSIKNVEMFDKDLAELTRTAEYYAYTGEQE